MPTPVNVGGLVGALGNLANVNARNADERRQRREQRMSTLGALGGAAVGGAVGGPQGALMGLNIGRQAGSALGGGQVDAAGTTASVLGLMNYQQQQDAAAKEEAAKQNLQSVLAPRPATEEPGAGLTGGVSAQPTEAEITSALAGVSPGLAAQSLMQRRSQGFQAEQGAVEREFRSSESAEDRAFRQQQNEANRTFQADQSKLARDFRAQLAEEEAALKRELETTKALNKQESPGQLMTRLMNKRINNEPLTNAEQDALAVLAQSNTMQAVFARRQFPALFGDNVPAQPAAGAAGQYTEQSPAKPTTQEAYDALPSGAVFIDPGDGRLKRKP